MPFLTVNIEFEQFSLKVVESVKIESSWQKLTDTAIITMPRALKFKNANIKDVFKVGQKVDIYLGYDGDNKFEFSGYITRISSDSPFTLECQDRMYELKKIKVNRAYSKANLKDVIADIVPGNIKTDVADIELGGLILSKITVAKALQELKEKFKIYSYFKDDTLVVGKIYTDDYESVKYEIEKNIIQNNLKFRTKDDIKIKVTAKSFNPGGKILKASVGDDDGPETETVYYNISSSNKLKQLAQNDYDQMKIEGYEGSVTTFGQPYVKHGWLAEIVSCQYPERNGKYFIDAVTTEFSNNGFHRIVKIGKRGG